MNYEVFVRIPSSHFEVTHETQEGRAKFLSFGKGSKKQVDQCPTTAVVTKQWHLEYEQSVL